MRHDFVNILSRLRNIVSTMPDDYVYVKPTHSGVCSYWQPGDLGEEGRPSCLIGRLMFDLGVPLADLRLWDSGHFVASNFKVVYASTPALHTLFDWRVAAMLDIVQRHQDNGTPWKYLPYLAEGFWEGMCHPVGG